MDEVMDSSAAGFALRARWAEAGKDPHVAAQLAREANGHGEHMLALAVAQRALGQLCLAAHPGEAVPLRQQMALSLARSGSTDEALEVLRDSLVAAVEDAETLGLLGRVHKDLAERAAREADPGPFRRQALDFYVRGFAVEQTPYCGINAAVLSALTGDLPQARKMARQVLELLPEPDRLWAAATVALVRMICGEEDEAREAFRLADCAGGLRRSDLAVVRREARCLAGVLHGDGTAYDNCFEPAAVALFHGRGDKLGDSEHMRLVRWLEDHHVVCVWSAAASGEEADFLERTAALGLESCAVLPEAAPREHCRRAAERASLVDSAADGAATSRGAEELARHVAAARAVARATSWDVPLLTVSTGPAPRYWADFPRGPFVLRDAPVAESGGAADPLRAVLCVSVAPGNAGLSSGQGDVRWLWENHAARCGSPGSPGGPYHFGWPTMAEAGRGAMDLQRCLSTEAAAGRCAFVLHATAQPPTDPRLEEWARRVYPGRIYTTGRFADLAALEGGRNFDLCYVGSIDGQAEPLGTRLYQLRPNRVGNVLG